MVTYSLLVKGCEMQAYAQLALKFRGILHRVDEAMTHPTYAEVNFLVTVTEYDKEQTTKRLSEWFTSDIHCGTPFPNGSLLIWSYVQEPVTA